MRSPPTCDILCFPPDPWTCSDPDRPLELLRRLSTRYRVMYLPSFSGDEPPRAAWRSYYRVRAQLRGRVRPAWAAESPTLHALALLRPRRAPEAATDPCDLAYYVAKFLFLASMLRFRPALLWVENPWAVEFLDWFPGVPVVYHACEHFRAAPCARGRALWCAYERRLTETARLVLCASRALYVAKSLLCDRDVQYLPPALDTTPFLAAAAPDAPPSPWLKDVPRPIAGYFGPLTGHLATATLIHCARVLPNVSFVLAAPSSTGRFRQLANLPNVHFRARLPPADVPSLLAGFDVALLPLCRTDRLLASHPAQLLPYLATGRPIVSALIPEVSSVAGPLVRVARSRADFLAALRAALAERDPAAVAQRQALAVRHNWQAYLDRLAPWLAAVASVPGVDLVPAFIERFNTLRLQQYLEFHDRVVALQAGDAADAPSSATPAAPVVAVPDEPVAARFPWLSLTSLDSTAAMLRLAGLAAPARGAGATAPPRRRKAGR